MKLTHTALTLPLLILLVPEPSWAHKGEKHANKPDVEASYAPAEQPASKQALETIGAQFRSAVRPIFQKKCFDCHSTQTRFPWYHSIPGIRQLIDQDIAEGREHLDMGGGFPFAGHATPKEDLEAIRQAIEKGSMPPFRYRVLHPGSRLTEEEERVVFNWVDQGLALMGSAAKTGEK